jgi:hypothetical protein
MVRLEFNSPIVHQVSSYLEVKIKDMSNKTVSNSGVSSGTFTGGKLSKKVTGNKTIKQINKAGKSVVAPGEKGSDKAYNKKVLNRFGL